MTDRLPKKRHQILAVDASQKRHEITWALADETPLAIRVNGASYAVMLMTPSDLEDFVYGFALAEGIIDRPDEILKTRVTDSSNGRQLDIDIVPARWERLELRQQRRNMAGQSACGLCGLDSLSHIMEALTPVEHDLKIDAAAITKALHDLDQHQPLNRETHSVHGAAWADLEGNIVFSREDVGRHNALDKLIGALLRGGHSLDQGFVVISSRCSFELVQKAVRGGIALIASVSAPTTMAVEIAEEMGVTLAAKSKDGIVLLSRPGRVCDT